MESTTLPIIHQMRILIQDPESLSFFSGDTWDVDEKHAIEFGNVAQAEEFCRQENLPLALIVVKFKDATSDVSYPASEQDDAQLKKYSTKRLR
jgi:hypothetical protein